jgi:hypothetical protein
MIQPQVKQLLMSLQHWMWLLLGLSSMVTTLATPAAFSLPLLAQQPYAFNVHAHCAIHLTYRY